MNKQMLELADKINALSLRERVMIVVTITALSGFLWWNLFAFPMLIKTKDFKKQNIMLESDIRVLNATTAAIQQRINEGVHKVKKQKLELLKKEFEKITEILEQKTLTLIEPDEMFELMQQLIFAESKLKLTSMKRKLVKPVFSSDQENSQQPAIYRHVLKVNFEGKFVNILNYIQKMESLEWKLIWDSITLTTTEYPVISVTIEISTLSDDQYWVGL